MCFIMLLVQIHKSKEPTVQKKSGDAMLFNGIVVPGTGDRGQ